MKATRTRKVQTNKTNHMSDDAFADLKEALEGALAFERGRSHGLSVTRIHAPRPPKAMSNKEIAIILPTPQTTEAMRLFSFINPKHS